MNESVIWSFLKQRGLNDCGAAGLMGNMYAESGLNPINLQNTYEKSLGMTDEQYTKAVDNGSYTNFVNDKAGYGLIQWTYWSRKQGILGYAQSTGRSIGDLTMQLEYVIKELGSYRLLDKLKTATSVREASNLILLQFEKPTDMSERVQTLRADYGQKYYDMFHTSSSAVNPKGESKMKYTNANPPMQCFMRQSSWYNGAGETTVKGVLWHSTGANNPNLRRYVQPDDNAQDRAKMLEVLGKNANGNDWNHITNSAGVHAWIGKLANGEVTTVQAGDWDKKAWGCGSGKYGSCNNGWIQFEICEDGLTDATYFNKVYREAVELTAYLCKLYNLNPQGTVNYNGVTVPVILCHQDSYQLGLGSNHGDVLHWFPKFGKTMQDVRNDVAALMGGSATTIATQDKDVAVNYQAKVTANGGLNCRTSPITGSVITTYPEQETVLLIETEQRCKSNTHRIDNLENELKELQSEQKAIYKIATSVELIAQRVSNIEGKVDDTNRKVDAQAKAWQETERKLSEKVNETENKPYKQIANNVNTVKVAIITCISTLLVSGIIGAIIAFGK